MPDSGPVPHPTDPGVASRPGAPRYSGRPAEPVPPAHQARLFVADSAGRLESPLLQPFQAVKKRPPALALACAKGTTAYNKSPSNAPRRQSCHSPDYLALLLPASMFLYPLLCLTFVCWKRLSISSLPI